MKATIQRIQRVVRSGARNTAWSASRSVSPSPVICAAPGVAGHPYSTGATLYKRLFRSGVNQAESDKSKSILSVRTCGALGVAAGVVGILLVEVKFSAPGLNLIPIPIPISHAEDNTPASSSNPGELNDFDFPALPRAVPAPPPARAAAEAVIPAPAQNVERPKPRLSIDTNVLINLFRAERGDRVDWELENSHIKKHFLDRYTLVISRSLESEVKRDLFTRRVNDNSEVELYRQRMQIEYFEPPEYPAVQSAARLTYNRCEHWAIANHRWWGFRGNQWRDLQAVFDAWASNMPHCTFDLDFCKRLATHDQPFRRGLSEGRIPMKDLYLLKRRNTGKLTTHPIHSEKEVLDARKYLCIVRD